MVANISIFNTYGILLLFVAQIVKFSNRSKILSLVFRSNVMKVKWKKLVLRVGVWLTLEVCFNYVGLDTIADYSEFIFDRKLIALNS